MKIIGNGTVGKSLAKALNIRAIGPGESKVIDNVVIVCVPTETINGKQDLTQVKQALNRIESKLIILRSTVLPGTTEKLENEIPIMFVPEFGFEKTMYNDLKHPEYYLFGYTRRSKKFLQLAKDNLPTSKEYIKMSAKSAEYAKYFTNIWGCSQIMLANSLYDWARENYKDALKGALKHKNIPKWGWNIFQDKEQGYSGKCLPKDIKAAISQYPHKLWRMYEEYNSDIRNET